jgi:hypothetical protein
MHSVAAIHRSPIYTFVLCLWWCVFWSEVDSFDYITELSYLAFVSPQIWSIVPATTDFAIVFFFNFLVFLCSDWRLVCILSFDTCALLQSIHRPQAIFCFFVCDGWCFCRKWILRSSGLTSLFCIGTLVVHQSFPASSRFQTRQQHSHCL